jgi:hypothetical protein
MTAVTTTTLSGYYKQVYGDKPERAVPEFAKCAEMIPFNQRDKLGKSYHIPVLLRRAQGWTLAGGQTAGTAFALNTPVPSKSEEATVTSVEFIHRDQIAYGAASRAASAGKAAFIDITKEVVMGMVESSGFVRELNLLYGQMPIGQIASDTYTSGTSGGFTLSAASWADGIWSQAENMYVDAYDVAALTTKINTNADIQVTGVDFATRTLTLTGNATDLAAMDGNQHYLVPRGWKDNSFAGLHKILSNTGTLFGISASTYSLWAGNSASAGNAAVTMGKLQSALVPALGKGLMEKVTVLMSAYTWTDLNTDHAALRRFAKEGKYDVKVGTESITYYGATGEVELKVHPMVQAGHAMIITPPCFERIGSTDTTFKLPNKQGEQFFRELENNAGFELRVYWDQALFCRRPARQVLLTGIVNNSLS